MRWRTAPPTYGRRLPLSPPALARCLPIALSGSDKRSGGQGAGRAGARGEGLVGEASRRPAGGVGAPQARAGLQPVPSARAGARVAAAAPAARKLCWASHVFAGRGSRGARLTGCRGSSCGGAARPGRGKERRRRWASQAGERLRLVSAGRRLGGELSLSFPSVICGRRQQRLGLPAGAEGRAGQARRAVRGAPKRARSLADSGVSGRAGFLARRVGREGRRCHVLPAPTPPRGLIKAAILWPALWHSGGVWRGSLDRRRALGAASGDLGRGRWPGKPRGSSAARGAF